MVSRVSHFVADYGIGERAKCVLRCMVPVPMFLSSWVLVIAHTKKLLMTTPAAVIVIRNVLSSFVFDMQVI